MGAGGSTASRRIAPLVSAGAVLVLATTLVMPSGGARAADETVLFSFAGPGFEFVALGPLLSDATGALYGTTAGGAASGGGILPGSSVFKLTPPAAPGGGWTKTILHGDRDGFLPGAGLVSDPLGNLYGTTEPRLIGEPGGTVFRLARPTQPGGWALRVLHRFNSLSDGFLPGGLIRDAAGALHGTTAFGGSDRHCGSLEPGCGTVFKLMPPANAGGRWTESVLYRFAGGGDGAFPEVSLLAGASGKLYGTTSGDASAKCSQGGCGTVFELDPSALAGAAWAETVLYRFKGGADGIAPTGLIAHAGSLYGTTQGGGDPDCSLSGETGCGTVFRLTPPATSGQPWTETVLYRFHGANDGAYPSPLTYRRGVFYGTTSDGGASKHCSGGCGSVFALTPPAAGGVWAEKIVYSFKGVTREGADGARPNGALVTGKDGRLYGVTSSGGANGHGTVFAIMP